MRTIIVLLFIYLTSSCSAQITIDYPYKTFLDTANNIYVTGFQYSENTINTNDIYIAKFPPNNGNPYWERKYPSYLGNDRGLDLAVDRKGNTFVTGFIFNSATSSNDIITLKYNPEGILVWDSIYDNPGDDKGMGIDITLNSDGEATEVFVTGYITSSESKKSIIVKKYNANNGQSLWQNIYKNTLGDVAATDILLDQGYAYVLGYAYKGVDRKNDIVLLTYSKSSNTLEDEIILNRSGSDELPTGLVISQMSDVIWMKSRIAVSSVSDGPEAGIRGRRFLTCSISPNWANDFEIKWINTYANCPECKSDVATSIAADESGDIYVAGYVFNNNNYYQSNGLDFATIKYKKETGKYAWRPGVKLHNFNDTSTTGVDDKASSIKVNHFKDVFVAGSSEGVPNGYAFVKYRQSTGNPIYELDRTFIPNFILDSEDDIQHLNKAAVLHIAKDGTPLMVVMGWNETNAHWAAVKYDAYGNVQYTVNNESGMSNKETKGENKARSKTEKDPGEKSLSIKNYPNPFNPSTLISYSIPHSGNVEIKIYDMLGKEIAELVNANIPEGSHSVTFNGSSYASGIYYYTMTLNGIRVDTKSMILLK